MSIPVLSAAVIALAALLMIALERAFPYDPRQRLFRDGFWNDLVWYTIVQSYILGLLISWLIRIVDRWTGLSSHGLVSGWPVWVQLIFFLILHDFYIYWFHRLQHISSLLWRIHEAHHSVRDVDWLAGSRSHALEILINQTIEFLPMTLLGCQPDLPILKGMVDAVWGMYIHSNINVHTGLLQRVLNGPEMHRWHHAVDSSGVGINFGTKFAFWDWLFGTARLPTAKPSGYGLAEVDYPSGYMEQQWFAFRPFGNPVQDHL